MSMTTELIDRLRQHADLLKEMGFDPDGMVMNDYKEAADTIQLLSEKLHASQMERSSQYYNDGWIPVSERTPKIHQHVLLSLRSLDVVTGFRGATEPYFYCDGAEVCYVEPQNVLAWRPLPEPYKIKRIGR